MSERASGRADLHTHTTASDGTWSPDELVREALRLGLGAIAITDHDSAAAVTEARRAANGTGLRVLAGVELSATDGRTDVHVLGYGAEPEEAELAAHLARFRESRRRRAEGMVEKLCGLGLEIAMDEVTAVAGQGAIGRPHIAVALHRRGHTKSFAEAFHKYIGYHGPAYVPKAALGFREAMSLLRRAGAVPVLAHPAITDRDDLLPELVSAGLMGIEVVHSKHDGTVERHYRRLAQELGLIPTGGSDSHGARDRPAPYLGQFTMPLETADRLEAMRSDLLRQRGAAGV